MAQAAPAPKVKLICGMISSREELFAQAREGLSGEFGPCDIVSAIIPFDLTHYYDQEMGSPLYRQFIAFEELIDADVLVAAKVATNEMEMAFATTLGQRARSVSEGTNQGGDVKMLTLTKDMPAPLRDGGMAPGRPRRPINLDPGYIEAGKLVLASMKNFSHRIYMGRGVFGEVTMQYRHGTWESLPWTFPDYGSGRYFGFLGQARERLMSSRSATVAAEGWQ